MEEIGRVGHYEFLGFETFAGKPQKWSNVPTFADGERRDARFDLPTDIAEDAYGILYVADTGNHCIRKIDRAGMVSTIAGHPRRPGEDRNPIDGIGPAARFRALNKMAINAEGVLFVSDGVLRAIDPDGCVRTVGLEKRVKPPSDASGPPGVRSLCVGPEDDLWILYSWRSTTPHRNEYTIVRWDGDSVEHIFRETSAYPGALAIDHARQLYLGREQNIFRMQLDGGGLEVFYEEPEPTPREEYLPRYSAAVGFAIDSAGNVFVADTYCGPFQIDTKTRKLTWVNEEFALDYPDDMGSWCVHIKQHDPYKGHLLICVPDRIIMSKEPVDDPAQQPVPG